MLQSSRKAQVSLSSSSTTSSSLSQLTCLKGRTITVKRLVPKVAFIVGATSILYIYLYNTKLTLRTTHEALSTLLNTNNFVEFYGGTTVTGNNSSSTATTSLCPNGVNSNQWLAGRRLGNIHDELSEDDTVALQQLAQLLHSTTTTTTTTRSNDLLSSLFGQSICFPQSQFRNVTAPSISFDEHNFNNSSSSSEDGSTGSVEDDRIIRQWAVKLIYVALYYHQHQYAIPEIVQRYHLPTNSQLTNNNCWSQKQLTEEYNVGRYDYECPGAKYLIVQLGGNGLGANVRGGMVPAMILGLMTNRIVLFVNNAPSSIKNATISNDLTSGWALASCPRKDYQCFFWPVSPCVLTEEDLLTNTYYLSSAESRLFKNRDIVPKGVDHYKVWVWQTAFQPRPNFHPPSADTLYDIVQTLIETTTIFTGYDVELLHRAAELIRIDEGERDHYNYAAATMKIQHTITMYMLRPHPQVTQQLDAILFDITPPNFDPERSVGLPVRASDKCDGESECLSFSQHMTVTGEMWGKHLNRTEIDVLKSSWQQPTVVFTTEATSMMEEQQLFVAENQTVLRYPQYNFQYMTNHHDVTPNSGFIRHVDATTHDADAIMISALSSLKAQLLPRVSIGNCCSNFHILINDFLSEDCGAASSNTFHCIQESDDPLLAVCCGWHHNCHERKKKLLLEMKERNVTETDEGQS